MDVVIKWLTGWVIEEVLSLYPSITESLNNKAPPLQERPYL